MFTIIQYEWKSIFRQRFSYLLFSLYTLLIFGVVLLQSNLGLEKNYTYTVSAISHLLLYILPILSLLTSSFSVLQDKESGYHRLLHTYPLSTFSYINGKWLGNWLGNLLLLTLSFYLVSTIATLFFGIALSSQHYSILVFIIGLSYFYSLFGTLIGSFSLNKWQGLIYSLLLWLLHIILWTSFLILVSRFLPFPWVKPFLQGSIFLNPAEYMRLLFILQFNSTSIFGTSHATFVTLLSGNIRELLGILYAIILYSICIIGSTKCLRGDTHATHS